MNSSYTTSPGCQPAEFVFEKRLQQPSPSTQAFLIFMIIINILACPFIAVLNALVMIAVKTKSRLRAHKSNMLIALLASTDFVVGVVIQPVFVVVIILFLLEEPSVHCLLHFFILVLSSLVKTSVFHLALISGERYLAMKHPFAYITIVTKARLLVYSALAWLLSITVQILYLVSDRTLLVHINITFIGLSIAFIVFCHITVYRETRRHEQQLAAQQVTQEAREQFEKDKKALKLTSTILGVLLLCFMPLFVFAIIVRVKYGSKTTLEAMYVFFLFATSMTLLNSLLNPIIYSIRMRQFRVAFIELTCRTVNIAEAEEIEMRLFGAPNAVVTLEAGQDHEEQHQQDAEQANVNIAEAEEIEMRLFGAQNAVVTLEAGQEYERQDQQNMEQANMNNDENYNNDVLPQVQHVNYVVQQLNNNSNIYRIHYRHSI